MIYDTASLESLARKAGIKDIKKFSNRFIPTLALPLLATYFNLLLALFLLLFVFRLPHIAAWYLAKERRKKIQEELPLYIASLRWMIDIYPVQEAICSISFGEVSKALAGFCDRYSKGESFESALLSCAVFPELQELAKRLTVIYRTGSGLDLLDLYSNKLSSENLSRVRNSAARMQIFAVAYTAVIAVLPAMYSGITIFSPVGNIMPLAFLAGSSLVMTWKLID